jgi:hypothetical protein
MMNTTYLEPRLQKLIDLGETGTNILHGELKNLMLEGQCDALAHVYALTYQLSFAIAERSKR